MAKKKASAANLPETIETRILLIRGHRVMLDNDLAALYGVPTKRLNEQVLRNADRFPSDFCFQLSAEEFAELRRDLTNDGMRQRGAKYRPWVFTEHGVAMLSSVLNSPQAVRVNIEIIRAFVRLRRLLATPGELISQLNKLAESVQLHDEQIIAISDILRRMMEPAPTPPKRRIGFHTENHDQAKV